MNLNTPPVIKIGESCPHKNGLNKPCKHYFIGVYQGSLCSNHEKWESDKRASLVRIPEHCRLKKGILKRWFK